MKRKNTFLRTLAASFVLVLATTVPQLSAQARPDASNEKSLPGEQPGALAQANLAKSRPKPPFDLTGNWMFSPQMNRDNGVFNFLPLPKLKPAAKALYEAGQKAEAEGKAFHNDVGACWPAGMPMMMTRVWPNQT